MAGMSNVKIRLVLVFFTSLFCVLAFSRFNKADKNFNISVTKEVSHQLADSKDFIGVNNTYSQQHQSSVLLSRRCPHTQTETRLRDLNAWCEKNRVGNGRYTNESLGPLYVNDQYKVVYCHIPKTGCTNWKKYFILLSGKTNFTKVPQIMGTEAHSTLFQKSVKSLASYSEDDQRRILDTYFKFIIVRHPLTRLLSAYRNKLAVKNSMFEIYNAKILKYHSRRTGLQSGARSTLEEFLRYLTDPTGQNIHSNIHWQTFHRICNPCRIRYDFIGQVETMAADAKQILQSIDAPYSFPDWNVTSDDLLQKEFKNLPETLISRVVQAYKDDIDAFGYNC